ncbi:MAG TPA: FecR domain-containing protein [Blastocatellia bacterium]|nr:FecR domain-containing protein [Blastocatellia bacterium]
MILRIDSISLRRGIRWSCLLFLLAASIQCLGATALAQAVDARVASVKGTALRRNNQRSFILARGDSLNPGDEVDTRGGGRVVIELTDGSVVIVHPNSRIVISNFRAAASMREMFRILIGRVRIKVAHYGGKPNPYRVNSPTASILVRGTEFSVAVEPSGDTRVEVYEGLVEVQSLSDSSRRAFLSKGQGALLKPNEDIRFYTPGQGNRTEERDGRNDRGDGSNDGDGGSDDGADDRDDKASLNAKTNSNSGASLNANTSLNTKTNVNAGNNADDGDDIARLNVKTAKTNANTGGNANTNANAGHNADTDDNVGVNAKAAKTNANAGANAKTNVNTNASAAMKDNGGVNAKSKDNGGVNVKANANATENANAGVSAKTKDNGGVNAKTSANAVTKDNGGINAKTNANSAEKDNGGVNAKTKDNGGVNAKTNANAGASVAEKDNGGVNAKAKDNGGVNAKTNANAGASAAEKDNGGVNAKAKDNGGVNAKTNANAGVGSATNANAGLTTATNDVGLTTATNDNVGAGVAGNANAGANASPNANAKRNDVGGGAGAAGKSAARRPDGSRMGRERETSVEAAGKSAARPSGHDNPTRDDVAADATTSARTLLTNNSERYVDSLAMRGWSLPLQRFAAFADSHFDSLDNPAYSTEFASIEGRAWLIPFFNKSRSSDLQSGSAGFPLSGNPIGPFDSGLLAQADFFIPLEKVRMVIGGAVAISSDRSQSLTVDQASASLIGLLPGGGQVSRNIAVSTETTSITGSLMAARRFGDDGRTSVGAGVEWVSSGDDLRGQVALVDGARALAIEGLEAEAQIRRLRFRLGITRALGRGHKLGLVYSHELATADDGDRSRFFTGGPLGLDSTRQEGRSSSVSIRLRGLLTRRLFYGLQGSLLWGESDGQIRRSAVTDSTTRADVNSAALGFGVGFALRRATVLSSDFAFGLSGIHEERLEDATGNLVEGRRERGRFVSGRVGLQTDVWRSMFFSASTLVFRRADTTDLDLRPDLFGRRLTSLGLVELSGRSRRNSTSIFSDFGSGWRFNRNMLAEYIFSINNGLGPTRHVFLLRYTFKRED